MRDEETFTFDWAYIKTEAREAARIYFAPLAWPAKLARWLWAYPPRLMLVAMVGIALVPVALIWRALSGE